MYSKLKRANISIHYQTTETRMSAVHGPLVSNGLILAYLELDTFRQRDGEGGDGALWDGGEGEV